MRESEEGFGYTLGLNESGLGNQGERMGRENRIWEEGREGILLNGTALWTKDEVDQYICFELKE